MSMAYFEGGGCVISQAAASLLCEHIEGRTLDDLAAFTAADMLGLIDIPLLPRRQDCGLLALRVLKNIVYFPHPLTLVHMESDAQNSAKRRVPPLWVISGASR